MRKKYNNKGWLLFIIMAVIFIWIVRGREEKQEEKISDSQLNSEQDQPDAETAGKVATAKAQEEEMKSQEEVENQGEKAEEAVTTGMLLNDVKRMDAGSILDMSELDSNFIKELFYSDTITDQLYEKINGVSYQENEVVLREDLKYLRILHMGFDGKTHIGELIVNAQIAEDVLDIMEQLYENAYPIEKVILIDQYGADDDLSMADNNSSAFNYRVIAGTNRLSKHGMGLAIDINPRYNPYVRTGKDGETIIDPENGTEFANRSRDFTYKIVEDDLCCRLFKEHGFTWGGSWDTVKDYQHFEKAMD